MQRLWDVEKLSPNDHCNEFSSFFEYFWAYYIFIQFTIVLWIPDVVWFTLNSTKLNEKKTHTYTNWKCKDAHRTVQHCSAWYCLLLNLSTFLHTLFILHATGTTDLKMENFNFVTTLISIIEFRFDFIHLWMMYICVCSTCILNTNNGYACCASSETGKGETEIKSEGKEKK